VSGGEPVLRFGIVGLGFAAKQMLPSLAAFPQARITAAADPRPQAREAFAAEFGGSTHEDAEAVCRSRDVDAVYIASPHRFHREQVIAAAEAGKHILVEKPMALSLAECDAMIAAVERAGVKMVVGHTHSFDPPIVKMREIVRSGELGPLAMINTWLYGNFLYRPRRPEELRTELGGGIIYNQVPHQVDVVRLLGGGMVRSIRSMAWALDPERPTEGSHVSFLQFENGSAASMVYSGYDFFDSDEFHFWVAESGEAKAPNRHGTARAALRKIGSADAEAALKAANAYGGKPRPGTPAGAPARHHHPHFGVLIASCAHGDLRPSADGVLVYGRDGVREIPVPVGPAFPDKTGVVRELYDSIVHDQPPLHDGRWGKATMEVAEAVLTSAREQREIVLSHQVPVTD
jgi:phthalate 4,5-cis-dihydrodiol dehydrogenase